MLSEEMIDADYLPGEWIFSCRTFHGGVMYNAGQNFPAIARRADQLLYRLIKKGEDPRFSLPLIPSIPPIKILRVMRTVREDARGEMVKSGEIIETKTLSPEARAIQMQFLLESAARPPLNGDAIFDKVQVLEFIIR